MNNNMASILEKGRFFEETGREDKNREVSRLPRTVARKNPVLLETEGGEGRDLDGLFFEFIKKAEFVTVDDPTSYRKYVAIIPPKIASREATAQDKCGNFYNPESLFTRTALMIANLKLMWQEKLTEAEVMAQYSELTTGGWIKDIRDLEAMLEGDLGLIKKGKVRKKIDIKEKQPVGAYSKEETDSHRLDIRDMPVLEQKAEVRKQQKGKRIKVFSAVGGATMVLASACTQQVIVEQTAAPESTNTVETNTTVPETEVAKTPTEGATETVPEVTVTEVPIIKMDLSGGGYSEEQLNLIENDPNLVLRIKSLSELWMPFWATADEPAFSMDAITEERVMTSVKFDPTDPHNPDKALVVIESEDYPEVWITQPVDKINRNFMATVPNIDAEGNPIDKNPGHVNVSGLGLVKYGIAAGDGSWILQCRHGLPTRVDAEGKVVEVLNMATGNWERVSLVEGNIFFDPQSEADFPMVAESPSPIDEPEKFAAWQTEYLKMIEEGLGDFNGPYLNTILNGTKYNSGVFVFGKSNEWEAVGSYKFKWIDQDGNSNIIINKTFAIQDTEGNKIPITITYTTPNSLVFNQSWGYKTPNDHRALYIRFEWEDNYFADDFIDNFLPNREDNINYPYNDAIIRGMIGTEEQRDQLSLSRFVFSTFE